MAKAGGGAEGPGLRTHPVGTILTQARRYARLRDLVMAAVVNLNRFRKAKQRAEAERRAAENRAAFGRTKTARRDADDERERVQRELDGKRIE